MILPNKVTPPVNSLIVIGASILEIIEKGSSEIDDIFNELNKEYPIEISFTKYLLCLDFLFIVGRIKGTNEISKT